MCQETEVQSLGWEDLLEKGMATYSSFLAWRIPWTEEPGRLQSMGSQRAGHDWATFTFTTKNILKNVVSALIAMSNEGVQNILSNSRTEWQLHGSTVQSPKVTVLKKTKLTWMLKFWMLSLKKNKQKLVHYLLFLSVYATFHCPISKESYKFLCS